MLKLKSLSILASLPLTLNPIDGSHPQASCISETSSNVNFFETIETILFPQDMIQDIYKLHFNIIHKSTGVT